MPFRYYKNVKAPHLAPPATEDPTDTKPTDVYQPAKRYTILHPWSHKVTTTSNRIISHNRTKNVQRSRIAHILLPPSQAPDHHMDHPNSILLDHPENGILFATDFISTSTTLLPGHLVAPPSNIQPGQSFNHPNFPAPIHMNYRQFWHPPATKPKHHIIHLTSPVVNTTTEQCIKMCYIECKIS